MSSNPLFEGQWNGNQISPDQKVNQRLPTQRVNLSALCQQIQRNVLPLITKLGVHTPGYLFAAGFRYTGRGDTARCEHCTLEVSHWTLDMNPFDIHFERSPHCQFIRSMKPFSSTNALSSSSSTTDLRNLPGSNENENPPKRRKIETINLKSQTNTSIEADLLQRVRKRTFSHWPHRTIPSNTQMIDAGFFNCNVNDRAVCMDCDLICHRWTPNVDDPSEVHKTLSPQCKYVKEHLMNRELPRIINPNQNSMRAVEGNHSLQFSAFLHPTAQNNGHRGVRKPVAVSSTTPNDKILPIDDMILGGFFNTDSKAVETCSYCNKSLQNLGFNDDPMINYALWLLHFAHTGQLNDDDGLYHKTQGSKQAKQKCAIGNKLKKTGDSDVLSHNNLLEDSRQLSSRDERLVSRIIAAKFNLPISERLGDRNLIHQLQIKREDSILDLDLLIACAVLQKQIDCIDGKKEKITIPGVRMNQIREQNKKEQAAILAQHQTTLRLISYGTAQARLRNASNSADVNMTTTNATNHEDQSGNLVLSNPCLRCWTEEKRLACIPCGHLVVCVSCGDALRTCPVCRRDITLFVQNGPPDKDHSKDDPSKSGNHNTERWLAPLYRLLIQIRAIVPSFTNRPDGQTASRMPAVEFEHTGVRDAVRREHYNHGVSSRTLDMDPSTIHSEQSSHYPVIRSRAERSLSNAPSSSSNTAVRDASIY